MIPIIFAGIGAVFCIDYLDNTFIKIAGVIGFFLGSLAVNYLFRPRYRHIDFKSSDYWLEDSFPLEPIKEDEKGNPIYVGKCVNKVGDVSFIYKCVGADNKVKIRKVPKELSKVIYDSRPEVRLYLASTIVKPNYIISVFEREIRTVVAEIHTPDAAAAFSKDIAF